MTLNCDSLTSFHCDAIDLSPLVKLVAVSNCDDLPSLYIYSAFFLYNSYKKRVNVVKRALAQWLLRDDGKFSIFPSFTHPANRVREPETFPTTTIHTRRDEILFFRFSFFLRLLPRTCITHAEHKLLNNIYPFSLVGSQQEGQS